MLDQRSLPLAGKDRLRHDPRHILLFLLSQGPSRGSFP
jgi:hypothetical protein